MSRAGVGLRMLLVLAVVYGTTALPLTHKLSRAKESAGAEVGAHSQCLNQVKTFLNEHVLTSHAPNVDHIMDLHTHAFSANDADFWARHFIVRDISFAVCKRTAQWIYNGVFNGIGGGNAYNNPNEEITTISFGASAAHATPNNWQNTILWKGAGLNPFPGGGRVCYVDLTDTAANGLGHQFVIEAPTATTLRHYQSFVGCYTSKDWVGSHTGFRDGIEYRPQHDCNPFAAKARHGGGQLLTHNVGNANAYLADIQTLIDEFHGTAAPFANIAAAYYNLFGVDVGTSTPGHVMAGVQLQFKCIDRSAAQCTTNANALRADVTTWKNSAAAHLNGLDADTVMFYLVGPTNLQDYTTSYNWVNGLGGGYAPLATSIRAKAKAYRAQVDGWQKGWCPHSGTFQKGAEYRIKFRNPSTGVMDATFQALTTANGPYNAQATRGGFFKYVGPIHPLHTTMELVCTTNGVTAHTPVAFQAQCTAWTIKRNGGANGSVNVQVKQSAAARWELQICLDPQREVTKARFVPSEKMW